MLNGQELALDRVHSGDQRKVQVDRYKEASRVLGGG